MSEKLVAKQDSLTLSGDSLLHEESKWKTCCRYSRPYKFAIFCVFSCSFFLVYWIIVGPFLISEFQPHNAQKTDKWSVISLSLYWVIAFLIWLFIMLCLFLICKRLDSLQRDHKLETYGTDTFVTPSALNITKHNRPRILRLTDIKEEKPVNDLSFDKNKTNVVDDKRDTDVPDKAQRGKSKKQKDLPPLVIHGHNSGKDDKHDDTVNLEENVGKEKESEEALKSGNDIPRSRAESMQKYVKLLTVTPEEEADDKTPNKPLSPRELFFIDLVTQAEKAEEVKSNNEPDGSKGEHFFPSNSTPIAKGNAKDEKSESVEIPISSTADEGTYFIANVDSPESPKTEVFLEIRPDPEPDTESANLINEKPILVLRENSQNREKRNTNEKVKIFEI